MPTFTRIIWILAWVSLLTDMASEMLYPIIPLYLQQIGFTVAGIGWLEGTVQFLAGISKGYFGKRSDEIGRRLPFIQWGYTLSAHSKPLMGWLSHPIWILGVRGMDRLGKGMRTAPRDAWLSQEAGPQKARVFGFHRSMDTWGAAIGPLLALIYLLNNPNDYATLFLLAFLPGMLSVALLLTLREKPSTTTIGKRAGFLSYLSYWKEAPSAFRKMVPALLLFALAQGERPTTDSKALPVEGVVTYTGPLPRPVPVAEAGLERQLVEVQAKHKGAVIAEQRDEVRDVGIGG